MKQLAILTLAVFSLAACQSTQSASGSCPPLVDYTLEQQQQAAKELKGVSKQQIAQMIVDYRKLREACRVSE
jgi:hypothetical protein